MGCEESKFCASKNNVSKKYVARLLKLGLRPEEVDHLFKLMKEQVSVPKYVIRVSITTHWYYSLKFKYRRNSNNILCSL